MARDCTLAAAAGRRGDLRREIGSIKKRLSEMASFARELFMVHVQYRQPT